NATITSPATTATPSAQTAISTVASGHVRCMSSFANIHTVHLLHPPAPHAHEARAVGDAREFHSVPHLAHAVEPLGMPADRVQRALQFVGDLGRRNTQREVLEHLLLPVAERINRRARSCFLCRDQTSQRPSPASSPRPVSPETYSRSPRARRSVLGSAASA